MNLLRFFLCATLVAVVGCSKDTPPPVPGKGKLQVVGGDTHDWGTVKPAKLSATIQLKNIGDGDLDIKDVHPGCGCTTAPIDKKHLKPGELANIAVTLDVGQHSGELIKNITVTTNESPDSTKVINLKAKIKRAITFEPMGYIVLGDALPGVAKAATTIRISNTGDTAVMIHHPELFPGANLKVRFEMPDSMTLKPGDTFDLKSFVTPNDTMKQATGLVGVARMKTSSGELPYMDIQVTGSMKQKPRK